LIEKIRKHSMLLGGILSPHDAWLLLRGMRTLSLRVRRHNATALRLAEVLESHSAVSQVYYPGLKSHPQHALAAKQMSGFGGVLGLCVNGGDDAAERFICALRRFRRASSIGSVESLVVHPSAMWRQTLTPAELEKRGVTAGLIRLSVGIDAADDLIEDVSSALDASRAA
jgi:methionine-gamma-lyase